VAEIEIHPRDLLRDLRAFEYVFALKQFSFLFTSARLARARPCVHRL